MESLSVTLIAVVWFLVWIGFSVFAVQFAFRLNRSQFTQLKGYAKWLAYYGIGFSIFLVFTIGLSLALVLAALIVNAI